MTGYFKSPIGLLEIKFDDEAVQSIYFIEEEMETDPSNAILAQCKKELEEYFAGNRMTFEFPQRQSGSPFQHKVWNELTKIPYGRTISYLDLAKRLKDVKVIRAAANANGQNNLPIVVPCHRVIGSNGKLVGYGGGLWRKRWLLDHEAKFSAGLQELF